MSPQACIIVGIIVAAASLYVWYVWNKEIPHWSTMIEALESETATLPSSATQSVQLSEPTQEAIEHYDYAIDLLKKAGSSKLSDTLKLDVASELALAVKDPRCAFPPAYALLAMMMNEMGKDVEAERYAKIALQQDPNEFRAQLVLIDVAVEDVQLINLRPGHFIHFESPKGRDLAEQVVGSVVGTILGSAVKSASTLAQSGWAANKQAKFKNELETLSVIFKNLCDTNTDPNEFIFMGETLIGLVLQRDFILLRDFAFFVRCNPATIAIEGAFAV